MLAKGSKSDILFRLDGGVDKPVLNVETKHKLEVLCPARAASDLVKARKAYVVRTARGRG